MPSPSDVWQTTQRAHLAAHLQWAAHSPLYAPLKLETQNSKLKNPLDLLTSLPLTTKDDLARAGRSAHAVPPHDIAEWVCTSGTSGRPLDVPLTQRDLDRLAQNEAAAFSLAGVRPHDLLLLVVGMDRMFVAGLAYWLGARKLNATTTRVGPLLSGDPNSLTNLLARLTSNPSSLNPQASSHSADRRTFLIAVPSFLTNIARPPHPLAGIIAIGEPTRTADLEPNTLAARLSQTLACPVMSTYALTETCATFAEGPLCKGGHLNPELAILEILDDAGNPLPDGQIGEVVITPLGVEGMPLLRFRTGDMAAQFSDPCPCGRTTPRLGPIVGRRQQLLKLRGTNVYPTAILEALRSIPEVADCVLVAERAPDLSDHLTLHIHLHTGDPATLQCTIEKRLRSLLRVTPNIRITPEPELKSLMFSTSARKAQRFIDRR